MAEIKEISDARRKRHARKTLKKIIFCFSVIVIILAAVFIKQNASSENIVAVFSDFFGSIGSGGKYPIVIPGSATKSVVSRGSGAGVVTGTQFITYSKNGKQMGTWIHGFSNPSVERAGNKFLLFDRGGKSVKAFSKTRLLWNETFEEQIYGATISGRYIAVTTASPTYSCEVKVYNTSYHELMTWYCAEGRVTDVAFHGRNMYVSVARAENGIFYTDIYCIGIRSKTENGKVSLSGTLGVSLIPLGGNIAVVGDERTDILNASLSTVGTYGYGGKILSGVNDNQDGSLILALSDNDNGRGTAVCLINSSGEEKGSVNISGEIKSAVGYKNKLICAYDDEVMIYNVSSEKSKTVKTDIDVYDISAGSDGVYLLGVSKINRIKL